MDWSDINIWGTGHVLGSTTRDWSDINIWGTGHVLGSTTRDWSDINIWGTGQGLREHYRSKVCHSTPKQGFNNECCEQINSSGNVTHSIQTL